MMRRSLVLVLALSTCSACTAPLQGPEANLHAIATPDPVPQVLRAVPQAAPGPTPGTGRWRAWVPRQVQPNGDVTEGHWLELSLESPAAEFLEPVTPMPRAPKTHFGAKSPAQAQQQLPGQPQTVPQATPTPVLPSGLLRGSQASPVRSILGGQ